MSHTVTTEDVHAFIQEQIAKHTVQGNTGELRHLRRVSAFLARVAEDVGDTPNQQRFLTLYSAANRMFEDQPIDRSDRV